MKLGQNLLDRARYLEPCQSPLDHDSLHTAFPTLLPQRPLHSLPNPLDNDIRLRLSFHYVLAAEHTRAHENRPPVPAGGRRVRIRAPDVRGRVVADHVDGF